MNQVDEPPQGLPEELPATIEADDLATILDALKTGICGWSWRDGIAQTARDLQHLAQLAAALAVVARAYNATQEPLLRLHRADDEAAKKWLFERWISHTGRPAIRDTGARLALETLGWRGVLERLASDEELATTFQGLIARFLTLRSSGQADGEGGHRP